MSEPRERNHRRSTAAHDQADAASHVDTPGRRTRTGGAGTADPLDIADAVIDALRDTHVPRLETAAKSGKPLAATEQSTIRSQVKKLDKALEAGARRRDDARRKQLVAERDELVARIAPLVELETSSDVADAADDRFLDTLVYFADRGFRVMDGPKPVAVEQGSPALGQLSEEVRSVVWLATSSTASTNATTASWWSQLRPRVASLLARARRRNADKVEQAEAALAAIDAMVVQGRSTGLIDAQRGNVALASPDESFYLEADAAMGTSIKEVAKLYQQATKAFYATGRDAMDRHGGRDAMHVAWSGFNFVYTLWFDVGELPAKLEKAKQAGVLAQTATFIDLLRYGVQMCGSVVTAVATTGQMLARAQGLAVAEAELASVVSRASSLKDAVPGHAAGRLPAVPVINAIAAIFTVVSGTLQLIDALQRGDERGALAAGAAIAQGLANLGGAVLAMFPGTAALAGIATPVTVTIFVWWVAIDAIGRLGGTLHEMRRDRKVRAVGQLVDQAARVANRGLDMAAATAAMLDPAQAASDPTIAEQIAAELQRRANAAAADVKTGFKALASHFIGDDPDRAGGYPDLVALLDPKAQGILSRGLSADDPITLTEQCQVVFASIDGLARHAVEERKREDD